MNSLSSSYAAKLTQVIQSYDWTQVDALAETLFECWQKRRIVFLCGNGGSAANASHLANDFLYGTNPQGRALRVLPLTDNASIITCLGNDTGYENIYSHQLKTQATPDDVLIAFSGSGNSPNVVKALETAQGLGMKTSAILGFDGGKCLEMVDQAIHFPIDDMQIAEDLQQTVGHMLTLSLREKIQAATK
ncbi:SIS domain-containing protein [Pelagicoccus sp. NFK12]|uniref:SIS domain-containing protein n=1 Tax=Pelagicoccus enzymogenes TaxID=2773457 RepID=A0A927IJ37_9BACT|nr:SIS domain-containing protein [Pelagicoccus enzymogenes]MBD5781408.1 SIS domain-containing protein [Pelagicoccus enzymogenes]MDQ8199182.1 SIS domain-containing protein [Pelagicoccus enzymogenes]